MSVSGVDGGDVGQAQGRRPRRGGQVAAPVGEAIGMFISWDTVETCGSGICTATK